MNGIWDTNIEVGDKERDVKVHWELSGGHYPATRETPEEFPDLNFQVIEMFHPITKKWYDVSETHYKNVFTKSHLSDLEEKIWDSNEFQEEPEQKEDADSWRDRMRDDANDPGVW